MDLNGLSINNVEHEVGFDYQNTVSVFLKFGVPWNPAQVRIRLKKADSFVEFVNDSGYLEQ